MGQKQTKVESAKNRTNPYTLAIANEQKTRERRSSTSSSIGDVVIENNKIANDFVSDISTVLTKYSIVGETKTKLIDDIELVIKEKYIKYFKEPRESISDNLKIQVWNKRNGDKIQGVCYCCDKKITYDNFECGHIIAFAQGGETTVNNMEAICRKCNRSMGKCDLEEYKKLLEAGQEEKTCNTCKTTVKSFNWEKHIQSKTHLSKAEKAIKDF